MDPGGEGDRPTAASGGPEALLAGVQGCDAEVAGLGTSALAEGLLWAADVEMVSDQVPELHGLGISVYNQADLEKGVLEEMDRIAQRKEAEECRRATEKKLLAVRKDITAARQRLDRLEKSVSLHQLASSHHVSPAIFTMCKDRDDKMEQLRKLEAEEKRLLDLEEGELGNSAKLCFEGALGREETKEEMLIRTGEMTPFGTAAAPHTGHSVLPSTSAGAELVRQVAPPRKRKKKEKLGTVVRRGIPPARTSCNSLLDEEFLLDPEVSDSGDAGLSDGDDEYQPEEEYLASDDDDDDPCKPLLVVKALHCPLLQFPPTGANYEKVERKGRQAKRATSRRAEESPKKRLKKLADDGNYATYLKRLKKHRQQKLVEKHRSIMEDEENDSTSGSTVEVDDEFRVPKVIWNKLYRYQQTGVRWLWELHRQGCGGIVGDEMGLGKTVQTIAFLAGLRHSHLRTPGDSFTGLGPVLLVCPTTVMHQWVREFHCWCPPLRVAILHESGSFAGTKESLVKQITKENGVLVTSYAGVSKLSRLLLKHDWHYVVLDEGHKIRNPDAQTTLACKQFRTPHRLILSGSPIQNSLRELWSLLDFVFPGKLGTLPVFMQEFAVPITQGGYSNASDVQVQTAYRCASALRDTIKPYLLRRMKEDVRTNLQLPDKNEQVLFCRFTDHQRALYQQYLDSADVASILVGRLQVFVGLMNLRKICNHPDLYDGGPKVFRDTDVATLPPEMRYGFPGRSGKMTVVESLLRLWKKQDHRVLLFTQSRQMLVILERFVQEQGYTYMVMTGATPIASRQPAIAKFNADPSVFVFLLTTRVGGLGVNLTGADRVVIYDPDWNPSTDTQARERAWRIGQRRDVTIYRLLTAGTIEEKIYHRQIFKQFLTNRVLKDPKQRRFFKTNDLHELFTLADDGKKKRTETSAIFAGTGSDIRLKRKKRMLDSSRKEGCESKLSLHASTSRSERPAAAVAFDTVKKAHTAGEVGIKADCSVSSSPSGGLTCASDSQGYAQLLSEKKIRQMRELARRLSQRIGQGPAKKSCDKQRGNSSVHSAMRHDVIMDSAAPDYALVEGEAERVAQQAIRRLQESRRRCLSAMSGVPTWTGLHGMSGAPPRPRFGQKQATGQAAPATSSQSKPPPKKPSSLMFKEANVFTQEEASSTPASSSELLACIRARKPAESFEPFLETGDGEFDELLSDLQTFVAFGASVDGQASTSEVLAAFKDKVHGRAPVFKALLSKICEFHRQQNGEGVWKLRPEFR
ncbi:DNA excision repair protein ERCC-6-like isoform X3 [Dermacentor variabilis]|uniref:DNA excision repair protein ERCC-6-like isoform X3 n=1 Tax=Dermacentor variabilis TaxID=34621 RepID=UPI003F5C5D0E